MNTQSAIRVAARKEKGGSPEDARQEAQHMLQIAEPAPVARERVVKETFFNTGEFTKKLRWLIQNPPRDCERMRITPSMAEVMLAWNTRNRPPSGKTIKKYADQMRDGRWHYTGVPIIFSTDRLLDGQNRLYACVAAGVPFDALVVFGSPDESFAFIDIGKTRTAANIFAIHGVKNHAVMASAIQWVNGYETERHGLMVNGSVSNGDHAWLYEQYLKHEGLQDSAWVAGLFGKVKLVSPSMMVAIHYICAKKHKGEADDFFRKVAEGIGFAGKKDPAYKLHKFFVDGAISGERVGRRTAAALTIKAWNASRRGRDVGAMRFAPEEIFPRVI
jgi:hypothetical protein